MNKNNARYVITNDGKVQINSNYIIDPIEFAQTSRDARGNILKTIPPYDQTPNVMSRPIFDAKSNFITDYCQQLLSSPGLVVSMLQDILNNKFDIQTMTLLLQKYADEVVQHLLDILLRFLGEIKDCLNDFVKVHPLVSLPVGALQFLINYLEMMAKDMAMNLMTLLRTCFDVNNDVNRQFLYNLKEKFQKWIKDKMDLLKAQDDAMTIDIRDKTKERTYCAICEGYFYETK